MLTKLFGSASRVKLLKLFLLHPGEKFYVREMSRFLNLQLNSVHRELLNLEEMGLIVSQSVANAALEQLPVPASAKPFGRPAKDNGAEKDKVKQERKYYQVNVDFVLYQELKSLIIKTQILYEKDFTGKLRKAGQIELLVLAGLFVNQLEAPVDILLVGSFDKSRLQKAVKELEKDLVREINYSIMSTEEFNYRREITDVFLYNILEGRKIVVVDEEGLFNF